ncbi:hypothetical protein KAU11_11005 [Candidatus Babeliales bacterium]|nr:hypothetical protein [Candidatus Babeliales bacterium]
MRRFSYSDQDGEHTLTEDEVIADYWEYWKGKVERVTRGKPTSAMITREHCIDDWVVVHWAYEMKEDNNG